MKPRYLCTYYDGNEYLTKIVHIDDTTAPNSSIETKVREEFGIEDDDDLLILCPLPEGEFTRMCHIPDGHGWVDLNEMENIYV